jgi:hypothetical protein
VSEFSLDISAFAKKAQDKAEQAIRKVVIDLSNRIVLKTPVDSGRLRANWQLTLNRPAIGELDEEDKNGGKTIARNTSKAFGLRLGQTVFITNNMPYAKIVEFGGFPNPVELGTYIPKGKRREVPGGGSVVGPAYIKLSQGGYSIQSPQGMVRVSIRELQAQIK